MIKAKSVLMTTMPAKDGKRFPISEIEKALSQTAVIGVVSCLGHDSTKPAAWTVPASLYMEPGSTRIAGTTWMPENTTEQTQINRLHCYL